MPVRSLRSRVLKWPDARAVDEAVRRWGTELASRNADVLRVGYFGSYARGNWGVGSDVDLVIVLARSDLPFERRATQFDTSALPVPADLLVYTLAEWQAMAVRPTGQRMGQETIWVYSGR